MVHIEPELLVAMYRRMVLIRQFEDKIYYLFLQGLMPGTIHLSQGQEAVAVGVCFNLRQDDFITTTHRPHGHCLAKGIPAKEMMAELFGKETGCCRGKGGSMHMGDPKWGVLPAIAIVGGNIPIAAGMALAYKFQKSDRVAVSFFGDGASNEGAFHEALNMAAIWDLPVIFVCENNLYGASTHLSKVTKIEHIAKRAEAYGMPGEIVDGNDVLAVHETAQRAVQKARSGEGPTLLECKTYRRGGHSRGDPAHYRPQEEVAQWLERDPIKIARQNLIENAILTTEEVDQIEKEVEVEIEEAVQFAQESPMPLPEDTLQDVYA